MARTHYIAGNWKMNTSKAEAVALAKDLVEQLKGKTNKYMIGQSPHRRRRHYGFSR